MQCLASATASSFSGAMVERVDRDKMGKSARVGYMPVHQLDHCHMARCRTHGIGRFPLWSSEWASQGRPPD
jgi:hypothetical protein